MNEYYFGTGFIVIGLVFSAIVKEIVIFFIILLLLVIHQFITLKVIQNEKKEMAKVL